MALLKIARIGHPVLLGRADEVVDPTDPEIARLVRDMIETMHDAAGAGLAAPQVHVPLRLFVFHVPAHRAEGQDDPARAADVLINPVLEPVGEAIVPRTEGCLSIPGMLGEVPRHARVRYRGVGLDGRARTGEAAGFLANVLQHETDHLDGILYPMRMTDLSRFGYADEILAARRAEEAEATPRDAGPSGGETR